MEETCGQDQLREELAFISSVPRIYADMQGITALLGMEPGNGSFRYPLALEPVELPYTILFSPANAQMRAMASRLEGFEPDAGADSMVLFLERYAIGTMPSCVRGVVQINSMSGSINGGALDAQLEENLGTLLRVCACLHSWLEHTGAVEIYRTAAPGRSGLLLEVQEEILGCRMVSGKERPDLLCVDGPFLFDNKKHVSMARPYGSGE